MTIESKLSSAAPTVDPSLLTGVPSIDEEHAELVSLLNSLSATIQVKLDSAAFSESLSQLGSQINTHFYNEERIFKSFSMPEDVVLSHVRAHTEILEQYTQLNIDLMQDKVLSRSVILRMIKDWIIGHVVSHDLIIKDYLPPRYVTTD